MSTPAGTRGTRDAWRVGGTLALAAGVAVAGCRHSPRPAPVPAVPVAAAGADEGYCWWAVFRSPLPADTVVARYADAYRRLKLAGVVVGRRADTAWAETRLTTLNGAHAGGTYTARIVAYQRGDSAHFRQYVAAVPPPGGWPRPADTTQAVDVGFGRHLEFCGELGGFARAGGTAPRFPDGEEKLDVWRRRP